MDGEPAVAAFAGAPPTATSRGLWTYYALIVTQAVSLVGIQIGGYAVSIAVFRGTGHATPLTLVAFFQNAPFVLLSGFGGALADRFDRRRMMLAANVAFLVTTALLLASFASGAFRLWHLYLITLAGSVAAAFERPAFQASVAMLVPEHHRDRANAIGQLTGPTAGIVAPALAGLLYAAIGVVGAIGVNIATFVIAIIVLVLVRIPRPAQTEAGHALQGSLWRQAFDGFRYLAARRILLWFCVAGSVFNLLFGFVQALESPYVLARTGDPRTFGLVLAVVNTGAVIGAVVMSAWGGTRPRIHTILPGSAVACVGLAAAGVARNGYSLALALFLMMFIVPMINAAFISLLQAKVAPDVQGRVFAAVFQIIGLTMPLAFLVAGPLADQVFEPAARTAAWASAVGWLVGTGRGAGMGMMLVLSGAVTGLFSLAVYAIPAIRRMEADLPDYAAAASSAAA